MTATAERTKSDATITMRVPARTRALIDAAAAAQGKSRTDFMLESARLTATNVLLDQRLFELDPAQSDALMAVLNNPPRATDALRTLMATPAPWA